MALQIILFGLFGVGLFLTEGSFLWSPAVCSSYSAGGVWRRSGRQRQGWTGEAVLGRRWMCFDLRLTPSC
ncbi:hypothetical protein AMECASPLE_011175 [Ameca splendens]|uniref:Uncharacterized protein n=1 Tax=Ameca splendens TaxID=208324 RepID=A0ABV0XPM9_9TELE